MRQVDSYPLVFRKKGRKDIIMLILLVIMVILAGLLWHNKERGQGKIEKEKAILTQKTWATLYIPDNNQGFVKRVVEQERSLSGGDMALFIMDELKKEKVVPEGVMIHNFTTNKDGLIFLNLSKDIYEKRGLIEEVFMVYSIVGSLISSIDGAKAVQFLVEDAPTYTINGLLYLYRPIEFNKDLLEE